MNRLREAAEKGVEIKAFLSDDSKMQVFRIEVEKSMEDGSGSFDKTWCLSNFSTILEIDSEKAAEIVTNIANMKMRRTLVQAVSSYRQRRIPSMIKSLHNLVSQYSASQESISWENKGEIEQMLVLYITHSESHEMSYAVAKALGVAEEFSHARIMELKTTIPKVVESESFVSEEDFFI